MNHHPYNCEHLRPKRFARRCGSRVGGLRVAVVGGDEQEALYRRAANTLDIDLTYIKPFHRQSPNADSTELSAPTEDVIDDLLARTKECDVVTLGHDSRLVCYLDILEGAGRTLRPAAPAFRFASDLASARRVLRECGFDVVDDQWIDSGDSAAVQQFTRTHGWPVRLRPRPDAPSATDPSVVRPFTDLDEIWTSNNTHSWLLEACQPFASELVVTIARRPTGDVHPYPIAETSPERCPSRPVAAVVKRRAAPIATSIAHGIEATGLFTVTFLATPDGRLLIDKVATGPHHTADMECVGQPIRYVDHLRAILDRPVPSARSA